MRSGSRGRIESKEAFLHGGATFSRWSFQPFRIQPGRKEAHDATLHEKTVCFLILTLTASAEAHSGDRVYPIYELTDEMLAKIDLRDGSVQEWADRLGEPSMTSLDFAYVYINRSLKKV